MSFKQREFETIAPRKHAINAIGNAIKKIATDNVLECKIALQLATRLYGFEVSPPLISKIFFLT
jgi:hypothetical protein